MTSFSRRASDIARGSFLSLALAGVVTALTAAPSQAEVPFPSCDRVECEDPYDYGAYLQHDPDDVLSPPSEEERVPDDFDPAGGDAWRYLSGTGLDVIGAWAFSTGRPDVVVAVLDSGIRWTSPDLILKAALNTDELPVPSDCGDPVSLSQLPHDCNGDGVVNLTDFEGQECDGVEISDENGDDDGSFDVQDLILICSDGVDGLDGAGSPVANGYIDDISGWDFFQDDNNPFDDTDYGHGTGEAQDSTGEANNGSGFPGVAPSAMFMPLRVGDSFVVTESDFSQAMVYAVDNGASLVQEALGAINQTAVGQAAVDYAHFRGIPVMASAADEESRHHNYPSNHEHTIWVNSIRDGDGTIAIEEEPKSYDLLNGCTNYGGRAWVAISSTSCSSEAVGRASGMTALLVSYGKNLAEAGTIEWFDEDRAIPFSAEEVRQLYRAAAEDIDYSDDLSLDMNSLISQTLSRGEGFDFGSSRFPTQAGWDQFTGYGRPEGSRLLEQVTEAIPPEADLAGGPAWFSIIDPTRTPKVKLVGSARADRNDGFIDWELEVGCGVQPETYTTLASGSAMVGFDQAKLTKWKPAETAADCGFKPGKRIQDPDAHSVTLRFIVRDRDGVRGEDRRTVAIHSDKTERFAPRRLAGSGEPPIVMADIDRDGVLDLVIATTDGVINVLEGRKGRSLPGFPVRTDTIAVHASPGWAPAGPVPVPNETVLGGPAVGDLDNDGHLEIVAASSEGAIYVFDDQGRPRDGFPQRTDPALSAIENRDRFNDADPGISSAPTLADLGGSPDLEIIAAAMDGHVYAWDASGAGVSGFPVRVADTSRVNLEPSGKATPNLDSEAKERLTKIIGSPAVGDLDDDGTPEIVVGSNEEYGGSEGFASESILLNLLLSGVVDLGGFEIDVAGRAYVIHADGNDHAGGPIREGWPVEVPLLVSQLLPNVATGTPGSPALADLDPTDEDDSLVVAIFGTAGPAVLFDADGNPVLGTNGEGLVEVLDNDFPGGGLVPGSEANAGSLDTPAIPALGSGAFGDLNGDGLPEYVAPTGGVRKLIDVAAAGFQSFGDHQISAWNPRTGGLAGDDPEAPAFPVLMEDMQFINSPSIADVDGDGMAEIVQGSGVYLVRAYRHDGSSPSGWPKFTHGWHIGTPAVGDVDGDGLVEVAVVTREGMLHVWDTPAEQTAAGLPWASHARDRHNSGNLSSGVDPTPAASAWTDALAWQLYAVVAGVDRLIDEAEPALAEALEESLAPDIAGPAAQALDGGDAVTGVADLVLLDQALADPEAAAAALSDLQAQYRKAVAHAAERAVDETSCGGDAECKSDKKKAKKLVSKADNSAKKGKDSKALKQRAKALGILAGL